MKKILSISLLLSMLFLYGCSTSNKLSANQLFEKKQECANMKDEIQSEQSEWVSVSEVFYSQEMNSCLYVLRGNGVKFIVDRFWDEFKGLYNAEDELDCYTVFKGYKEWEEKCLKESEKFEKKLQELKWE